MLKMKLQTAELAVELDFPLHSLHFGNRECGIRPVIVVELATLNGLSLLLLQYNKSIQYR
jgi:hypothetical protein